MWIRRDLQANWADATAQPVRILLGPRQCGKSAFLEQAKPEGFQYVTFDDINLRDAAAREPRLFLEQFGPRAILDEAQYVPSLFPEIKRRVDLFKKAKREGLATPDLSLWLTGSNRVLLDRGVAESLTGRASYFRMHPLSVAELRRAGLEPTLAELLLRGGWPELHAGPGENPIRYLNDHIETTLVKDLVATTGITKVAEFVRFLRLTAGRVGQLFVASEVARDAGVRSVTITEWLSFVERMLYVVVVPAFASSTTTRLIKAPKCYFSDVGLATCLQGWPSFETLLVSPQMGPLFENLVLTEIVRTRDNHLRDWEVSHFRTKEKEEIDFIVTSGPRHVALECKLSARAAAEYSPPPSAARIDALRHAVVSADGGPSGRAVEHVGLRDVGDFLLRALG